MRELKGLHHYLELHLVKRLLKGIVLVVFILIGKLNYITIFLLRIPLPIIHLILVIYMPNDLYIYDGKFCVFPHSSLGGHALGIREERQNAISLSLRIVSGERLILPCSEQGVHVA